MSIFTSRINIRRAIFTFSLNCTRSSSLQQIKPRIFTINSKAHSKITLTTKFNFIGSQNNTRKTIFYLPLIVGNRQFSQNSSSYNKHKEKESKIKEITAKENIWTIPNYLTLSRLIASPIIGYLILNDRYGLALSAFIYAGFTDLFDGFIARKYDMRTVLGTVMDPAADKILMTILTIVLAKKDLLPIPIAAVILGRDVGLIFASFYYRYISLPPPKTLGRYFDMSIPSAEVRPTLISKINTALQLTLMGVTLASPVFGWTDAQALIALQYTVAATTIWTGLSYTFSKDAVRILKPPVRYKDK